MGMVGETSILLNLVMFLLRIKIMTMIITKQQKNISGSRIILGTTATNVTGGVL